MTKIISLDFWGTLAFSNLEFKKAQYVLIKNYIPDISFSEFIDKFKEVKLQVDAMVESTSRQPNRIKLYSEMFPNWSQVDILSFINYSNELFLKYPPILMKGTSAWIDGLREKNYILYISSNTVFINGDVLSKFIFNELGIVHSNCNFSDELGVSKPNKLMFTQFPFKPDFHIGDNPLTDGKCLDYGIEFININVPRRWEI